jgi:hypothetical protein
MAIKKKLSTNKKAKSAGKASVKRQTMRDVFSTPSLTQIQKSIEQGKTHSAAAFRTMAGW